MDSMDSRPKITHDFCFKNAKFQIQIDGCNVSCLTCCNSYHFTVLFSIKFNGFLIWLEDGYSEMLKECKINTNKIVYLHEILYSLLTCEIG
jgi:hypothetical protein